MPTTHQLPREEWARYFAAFTERFFDDANPETATVEVLSPELGAQVAADRVRAHGIIYDPKSHALEVALEKLDHLVYHPKEVWVVEEEDGFVSIVEVVRTDGTKEIIRFERVGITPKKNA